VLDENLEPALVGVFCIVGAEAVAPSYAKQTRGMSLDDVNYERVQLCLRGLAADWWAVMTYLIHCGCSLEHARTIAFPSPANEKHPICAFFDLRPNQENPISALLICAYDGRFVLFLPKPRQ
jgi:hypothetical protein